MLKLKLLLSFQRNISKKYFDIKILDNFTTGKPFLFRGDMWIHKHILIHPYILPEHNSRIFPNRMMLDTGLMVLMSKWFPSLTKFAT